MRTEFDLAPLFRSTVGFDRLLDALLRASRLDPEEAGPPYDIVRTGEDEWCVTLAVPGFRPADLTVTARPNLLVIAGERTTPVPEEDRREVLHQGIVMPAFEHRFELADHVEVTGATLADGLLTVTLRRTLPEAMRPRRIEIAAPGSAAPPPPRLIEGTAPEEKAA